jgi:predicted acyl esterase
LRASLRAVDETTSEPGAPSLPCTSAEAVPINEPVSYRIPIIGAGYRFAAGHRLRLILTSDDQDPKFPADMSFRHASVGTSSLNRIATSSRLLLPVTAEIL